MDITLALLKYPSVKFGAVQTPGSHLRKRKIPFDVPLNEWRIDQYLEVFGRHFEILKYYCALREGNDFLTPKIAAELSQFSVDELTCHAYIILARKV